MADKRTFWVPLAVTGAFALALFGWAAAAGAEVTQEQVFQSINDNVRSTADWNKAIPYLILGAAVIVLCVAVNHHLKHRTVKQKSNNPRRLAREVCRKIRLRSVELRQLKMMAQEQQVQFPLTLILCPSLLGKAIRTPNARVDRAVVRQMVQRLRQGIVDRSQ